jgi:UDP-N-acetyl-D-mannosaminuronic acid dehydrogenase
MIALARQINDEMPAHLAALAAKALASRGLALQDSKIAVLGVAYLEDSDDTRNTPAVPVIDALQDQGARVVAHDPYVRELEGYELTRDLKLALQGTDAAVIVTKHKPYFELDLTWLKDIMRTPILVDGRDVLDAGAVRAAGFTYEAVGKGGGVPGGA